MIRMATYIAIKDIAAPRQWNSGISMTPDTVITTRPITPRNVLKLTFLTANRKVEARLFIANRIMMGDRILNTGIELKKSYSYNNVIIASEKIKQARVTNE